MAGSLACAVELYPRDAPESLLQSQQYSKELVRSLSLQVHHLPLLLIPPRPDKGGLGGGHGEIPASFTRNPKSATKPS